MIRVVVLSLLASCAGAPATRVGASFTPRFEPAPCDFKEVDATWSKAHHVECGWLHVRERRDTGTRTLKIWTAIARADKPSAQPPLLYIHGGPGLATVDYFFPYFPKSKTWTAFRADRDLVFAVAEENEVLCKTWQAAHAPAAFFAPVESDVPVLLYGGELDPATPFEDAVLAARRLSHATVVEVAGSSHAAMGRDDCTRSIARSFLANPTRPPDLTCLASRPPLTFHLDHLEEHVTSMK